MHGYADFIFYARLRASHWQTELLLGPNVWHLYMKTVQYWVLQGLKFGVPLRHLSGFMQHS